MLANLFLIASSDCILCIEETKSKKLKSDQAQNLQRETMKKRPKKGHFFLTKTFVEFRNATKGKTAFLSFFPLKKENETLNNN